MFYKPFITYLYRDYKCLKGGLKKSVTLKIIRSTICPLWISHLVSESDHQPTHPLTHQPTQQLTQKPNNPPAKPTTQQLIQKPTNQPINPLTQQPTSQPNNPPANPTTHQSTQQPTNPPTNPPANLFLSSTDHWRSPLIYNDIKPNKTKKRGNNNTNK